MSVTDELDDLEIQGVQTVIFGHDIMQWFADSIDANVDAIPDDSALDEAIEYMIGRIGPAGSRKGHVDRFIELFGRAVAADQYLERGTHYEITNEGQENEEIRINLPRTFDAVSKYARDHGIDDADLLNDHDDYRDRFREQAATSGSYVVRTMQYTPGVSNCTGIRTTAVMDSIEFDRDVLETNLELNDSDDSTASDDHNDANGDSTDQPDYLSAGEISTAGLKSLEEIPSVSGTAAGIWEEYGSPRTELVGENGSIDIHFKGYDTPDVPLSPGGEYEIDGLRYEQDQDGHEYYELRNSPAVDIERLDDAADEDEPVSIERIPDIGTSTGYETVTVEVVSWDSPETDAIAHSGIVKDATGIIDVVAFDELSELSNYPEGRHYRFENVQIDEYEADLQLILDPEITDWTEIQLGVGNLDHVSDESNQDLESATDGGSNTADTSDADRSTGSDDTASDDIASETAADADETDDTDDTDDYVEPDSDLSDADWKETLLMIIDANGNSIHPGALHEAVTDHSDKESDDAADLIRNAVDENYLRTTVDMNWTYRLKGAVDAQTQDESG